MLPQLLTHCCYSKQLEALFTSLFSSLTNPSPSFPVEPKDFPSPSPSPSPAPVSEASASATASILAEPEVTLSSLLSWLIWETPDATLHLYIPTLTHELYETLNSLLSRKNSTTGLTPTFLLTTLHLHLPPSALYLMDNGNLPSSAIYIKQLKSQYGTHRILSHTATTNHNYIALSGKQSRRNHPITITAQGDLPQTILPKPHTITFQLIMNN